MSVFNSIWADDYFTLESIYTSSIHQASFLERWRVFRQHKLRSVKCKWVTVPACPCFHSWINSSVCDQISVRLVVRQFNKSHVKSFICLPKCLNLRHFQDGLINDSQYFQGWCLHVIFWKYCLVCNSCADCRNTLYKAALERE